MSAINYASGISVPYINVFEAEGWISIGDSLVSGGSVDPNTIGSYGAPEGSLYLRSNGTNYIKTTNASFDTGWKPVVVEEDTGWVSLSYQSGFTGPTTPGQLQYRKYGKTVYLRGGASGSFSGGTLTRVNSTLLPTDCRPADHHRVGTFGTGVRGAAVEVRTDGQIHLGAENGVSGMTWVSACTSWLVD